MWTYYSELLATPVPRYTSYPTAAEFGETVGGAQQRDGLKDVAADEAISLYVHIPYCREICWYCGCNTGAANRGQRLTNYLANLHLEIDAVADVLSGRGIVSRIAFGGGSPNAISASQFTALAAKLRDRFAISAAAIWSVELDPRGFNAEFADAMQSVGIARASLGVQTFDPAIQAGIGRVQPAELIEQTTAMLRRAGVTSLNYDLMYGLPGQGITALIDSLERASATGADRLAVFGYAHVPHLLPRQRRIDASALPAAAERFGQAAAAYDYLVGEGWTPIGFDHFARPADPLAIASRSNRVRRNFQGFTDDPCDVSIGLGASSISRLPGMLVQNEKNSGRYGLLLANDHLPATRGIMTPPAETRRGAMIEQLLCNGSADLTGLPDLGEVQGRLRPFEARHLISWAGPRLSIHEDARPYARTIAATLDPWRNQSAVRFSSAV
nr:radical SAM protein [uncultured Sphingomonas sp.]